MADEKENPLVQNIENAVVSGMDDGFSELISDLNFWLLDFSFFPEDVFASLVKTISTDKFHKMEKGYSLLMIFSEIQNLELLNESQKDELIQIIEKIYPKLEWGNMCMVCAELIVQFYKDDRSLQILKKLMNTKVEGPRGLIPYGFYYFMGVCEDSHLKKEAFSQLKNLMNDKSEFVRYEAKLHFDKLSAKNN